MVFKEDNCINGSSKRDPIIHRESSSSRIKESNAFPRISILWMCKMSLGNSTHVLPSLFEVSAPVAFWTAY